MFQAQMNVNVRAPVLLCSLAAPHLIKTKGNIVNISSGIGLRAVRSNYLCILLPCTYGFKLTN